MRVRRRKEKNVARNLTLTSSLAKNFVYSNNLIYGGITFAGIENKYNIEKTKLKSRIDTMQPFDNTSTYTWVLERIKRTSNFVFQIVQN